MSVAVMDVCGEGVSPRLVRSRAIGMLQGGMAQGAVARETGLSRRTINKWWRIFFKGEKLTDKPRSGRPSRLNRMAKIVCAKAEGKRGQSVRKLAKRLTRKGHAISK